MNAPCAETSKADCEPLRGECKVTPHLTFIRRRNAFVKRCRFVDRVRVVLRLYVFTTPTATFSAETYGITVRARSGRKNHKTRARSVKGDTQRKHPRARMHAHTHNDWEHWRHVAKGSGVGWGLCERQGVGTFSTHTYIPFIHLMTCTIWIRARTVGSCGGGGRRAVSHQKCLGSGLNCPAALCEVDRMVCKQAGAQ